MGPSFSNLLTGLLIFLPLLPVPLVHLELTEIELLGQGSNFSTGPFLSLIEVLKQSGNLLIVYPLILDSSLPVQIFNLKQYILNFFSDVWQPPYSFTILINYRIYDLWVNTLRLRHLIWQFGLNVLSNLVLAALTILIGCFFDTTHEFFTGNH